jgi:hypothetical protein
MEVSMFRKFLLASVACVGFLSPLAFSANANAHEYRYEHRQVYRVFYRQPFGPWVFAGSFRSHRQAERFAEPYRFRGFAVAIR